MTKGICNLFGHLLVGEGVLLTHGRDDSDKEILTSIKVSLDLLANLRVGQLNIILGLTIISDQGQETIINVDELVLLTDDIGDLHVVGRGRDVFVLLAGEDVDTNEIDLGRAVLAGLGGAHVDDLAGTAADQDEAILAESGALEGEGHGGTGSGLLESLVFSVRHGSMCKRLGPLARDQKF